MIIVILWLDIYKPRNRDDFSLSPNSTACYQLKTKQTAFYILLENKQEGSKRVWQNDNDNGYMISIIHSINIQYPTMI